MARVKIKMKRRDRGWNRVVTEIQKPPVFVTVGVQGRDATKKHVAPETNTGATALESVDTETGEIAEFGAGAPPSVADVYAINEFGMGVPERSSLRSTVDAGRAKYMKLMRGMARAAVDGKLKLKRGAGLLGEIVVGDVKQAIADGIPPPNAESTIVAKGSSTPLIASGQVRGSITSRVKRARVGR